MLKIFKKFKKSNIKHSFYDEKEWKKIIKQFEKGKTKEKPVELKNSLVNRPLEGEIVKIENIKVPCNFKAPHKQKLQERKEYYNKHKYFKRPLILDEQNYIVDGYTTYLLALNMGFTYITIQRDK